MSNLDRILELARHGTENAQSQVPAERELKDVPVTQEPTQEAVGEFAEPLYTLQDELGLEDNILVDELARWMDGQDITEFVDTFRRHHEMPEGGHAEESVDAPGNVGKKKPKYQTFKPQEKTYTSTQKENVKADDSDKEEIPEAKAKPDFADIDGDGDEKETMKKAAKDKEVKENLQKAEEQIETLKEDCSCGHGSDCDCGPDCKCGCNAVTEETVTEAPTMDTTQLITLLKNSGLSEEAIDKKINEWANTPDGAAEEEATSHGEPYENFAQSVNLSLKRYLDAEDFKVGLKEHKVADIKEAYQEFKGVPVEEKKKD